MRLTIGENEGAILVALGGAPSGECLDVPKIRELTKIANPASSLMTMLGKSWIIMEQPKGEKPHYLITDLGERALSAWLVYFGGSVNP